MKKVRIGIIGVGGIAMNRHIRELLDCEDAQIVAICDVKPRALARARETVGLSDEKCYTDYRELIADEDVEAVEICTPNHLHAEMAIAVLKAGKPVNVEKPVALNYEQAVRMLQAERESESFAMTCFTYRYMPAVRYAKYLVDSGTIGEIVGLNVAYLKNSAFWEGRRLEWRFVKEYAGSGVIGDLGIHLIDLAQLLAGNITRLCATKEIVVKERRQLDCEEIGKVETEDSCSFLAQFEGGASGTFHITRCAIGHANTIRYDVYGTKGSISFDLNNPKLLNICTGEGNPKDYVNRTEEVPTEFFLTQEQAFVDAVQGKRDALFPTLEKGVQGQKIVDSILRSAEENRWVTLE